jgi:hypothetical protein
MKYYLSESDKRVLSQTINTVNNLPTKVKGNKRPTIKNAFAYAELTTQDDDGLWSAFEVYFDETGTPNELADGRIWGLDAPSIVVNGTVSSGQVMRVERYYLIDSEGKEQPVWVGSAVGGGTSFLYAIFKNHEGNQIYTCDVYPDGLFNSEGTFQEDVLVKVFNVDYGEVLPNSKLKCWPAESNSLGISYYSEAPTWQQDLP